MPITPPTSYSRNDDGYESSTSKERPSRILKMHENHPADIGFTPNLTGEELTAPPGPLIWWEVLGKVTINFRGESRTPAKKSESAIYNSPLTADNDYCELNFVTP